MRKFKPFKLRTACTFNSFHSVIKQYLKKHWMVCIALHVNIFAALTDHFPDPFVCENVACVFDVSVHYDVRKFDADAILYGDTRCKKMDISMFLAVFSV